MELRQKNYVLVSERAGSRIKGSNIGSQAFQVNYCTAPSSPQWNCG